MQDEATTSAGSVRSRSEVASDRHERDAGVFAIDVCVCTYRRSRALRRLLLSLAAQSTGLRFRVLVADNHETPTEASNVAGLAEQLKIDVDCFHAPAANIAIARNACLDRARAPLVAFIDDDEVAPPEWLAELHAGLRDYDAVFGPVLARYPADAPAWMLRGDWHSKVPPVRADGECDTGHTANVLMRRSCIGSRRFMPALGRSGGEDTLFFAMLKDDGARLGIAAAARVYEPVERDRMRFRWLCKRAYGSGQAHARMLLFNRQSRMRCVAVAGSKWLYCALAALLTAASPARWRRHVLRGSLHAGVIATALGAADLELYGR